MNRDDALEHDNGGPLFSKKTTELAHASDPETSGKAAAKAARDGVIAAGQNIALRLVMAHPGSTCKELAAMGCYIDEETEHARQRIGRRLPELLAAGLVHRKGERDGCALWWPGPEPGQEER